MAPPRKLRRRAAARRAARPASTSASRHDIGSLPARRPTPCVFTQSRASPPATTSLLVPGRFSGRRPGRDAVLSDPMSRRALTALSSPGAGRRPWRARPVDGRGGARAPRRRGGRRARPLRRPPAGRAGGRRRAGGCLWRASGRGACSPPRRCVFVAALALTLAVFAPGHRRAGRGRAALGPPRLSVGRPGALPGRRGGAAGRSGARPPARDRLAVGGALLAVLALVLEPDFSAAAIALAVAFAALAGGRRGRAAPAAGGGPAAHRAGDWRDALRVRGQPDPRLSLAGERPPRKRASRCWRWRTPTRPAPCTAVGLGHGSARRRLSSPASDYAFAVVGEELGRAGTFGVVAAWLAIGAGVVLAARSPAARHDPAARAAVVGDGHGARAPGGAAHRRLPGVAPDHRRDHAASQLRPRADDRLGRRAGAPGGRSCSKPGRSSA